MRTLTVAAAVMLAALAPASAQTLRTTLGEEPDALDPLLSRAGIALSVMTTMCSRLITQDKDAKFQPELATSWTWSPDALSLTLKLRPDALFHDGTKVDAAA